MSPSFTLFAYCLAFIGGAVGSMFRFWLSGVVSKRFGETFPYGTLVVNVAGSLVVGVGAGWLAHHDAASFASRRFVSAFVVVGFCGGLTTFSAFSLQTWNLMTSRRLGWALVNIVGSTAVCLAAVAAGWQLSGMRLGH